MLTCAIIALVICIIQSVLLFVAFCIPFSAMDSIEKLLSFLLTVPTIVLSILGIIGLFKIL